MDNTNKKTYSIGKFFVGFIIILFGLLLLAQNAGWIDLSGLKISWQILWPLLIILIGLSMLTSRGIVGTIITVILSILILGLVFILIFIPTNSKIIPDEVKVLIANPASVYCQKEGGTVDIRNNQDGSQTGFCVFKDNSECDEWLFLLNKCSMGQIHSDNSDNSLMKDVSISPSSAVKSPVLITGQAKGNWYFEASFPIKIYDDNGKLLGSAIAQAQGEWMTENFVPFTATLNFSNPDTLNGVIVLQKDNPSGLSQNDAEIRIPIHFQ